LCMIQKRNIEKENLKLNLFVELTKLLDVCSQENPMYIKVLRC
jgi:hypothetical protein